jgi:hypothetical protein
MQYGDTDQQHTADVDTLLDHAAAAGNRILTGTEAGSGSGNLAAALEAGADARGWWSYIHGAGEWVIVDTRWGRVTHHGWDKVIDSGSGHSARGLVWVTVDAGLGDLVAVAVTHLLTAKSSEDEPNANDRLRAAALEWADDHGPLAFVNADTNTDDATRNVWGSAGLVTCWDELGKWPATITTGAHNTIDVISRVAGDACGFTRAAAHPDLGLYGDHVLIDAVIETR